MGDGSEPAGTVPPQAAPLQTTGAAAAVAGFVTPPVSPPGSPEPARRDRSRDRERDRRPAGKAGAPGGKGPPTPHQVRERIRSLGGPQAKDCTPEETRQGLYFPDKNN